MKKLYYVCSRLNAVTREEIEDNRKKASTYMKIIDKLVGVKNSALALHSILPNYINDNNAVHRAFALDVGLKYLELCDCLVVCGLDQGISTGMMAEIDRAVVLKIPIYKLSDATSQYCLKPISLKELLVEGI